MKKSGKPPGRGGIADVYGDLKARWERALAESLADEEQSRHLAAEAKEDRRRSELSRQSAENNERASAQKAASAAQGRREAEALKKALDALGDVANATTEQHTAPVIEEASYGAKEGTQRRVILSLLQKTPGEKITYADTESALRDAGFELPLNPRNRRRALYDLFYRLVKIDEAHGRKWVEPDGSDGWIWRGPGIVA